MVGNKVGAYAQWQWPRHPGCDGGSAAVHGDVKQSVVIQRLLHTDMSGQTASLLGRATPSLRPWRWRGREAVLLGLGIT